MLDSVDTCCALLDSAREDAGHKEAELRSSSLRLDDFGVAYVDLGDPPETQICRKLR